MLNNAAIENRRNVKLILAKRALNKQTIEADDSQKNDSIDK